jgi:hypothetical protein
MVNCEQQTIQPSPTCCQPQAKQFQRFNFEREAVMATKKIAKFRLVANSIFCAFIAVTCIPLGLSEIFALSSDSAPVAIDSEGRDKALFASWIAFLFGVIALISLLRTVKALRTPSEQ